MWTDPLTIGHDYRKRIRDVWKSARRVNGLAANIPDDLSLFRQRR